MEEENGFIRFGKMRKKLSTWAASNIYPIVIFIASVLVLVFVPMIGSDADIGSMIPTEPSQAILYWVLKGMTVALNLTIFGAFRRQAKLSVKDNPNYIKANQILEKKKPKDYKPLSPVQFGFKQWGSKGGTLAISTAITTVALTNIVLYYDWITAVSCAVSIAIAIIFGLMTLSSEEYYWTHDYLLYAESIEEERNGN